MFVFLARLAGQVTSRGAVTCGRGGLRCVRAPPGSSASSAVMELKRVVGQCAPLFFLAVTFDVVGFLVLLVGLAASPQLGGRYYGDFLALTGAVFMFFGLGVWVMWYAGNLGVDGKRRTGFGRIARQLSSLRGAGGGWKEEEEEDEVEVYVDEEEKKEKGVEEEKEKEKGQEEEEEKEKDEEEDKKKEKEEEEKEEEEKEKEEDGGKGEENGAYTNEAYEPTDNEIV